MNRKFTWFVTPLLLACLHLAEAQQAPKIPRIGFVAARPQPDGRVEAFRRGLRDLGYIEGGNIKIEYRGHKDRSQLTGLVEELVRQKIDVIVTRGAARRAGPLAGKVPVIFGFSDPVEAGLVKSLARPGANMTGMTMLAF